MKIRHYIEIENKKEIFQSDITKALGRDQSNISRELRRNKGLKSYRHKQANNFAQDCHKTKERAVKLTEDVTIIIKEYLQKD